MKIQTCKEYNAEDMRKWRERVDAWQKDKFTNNVIPQIAFVGFRKRNGEMKNYGYVASDEHSAYWAKTKDEAIQKWGKDNVPL